MTARARLRLSPWQLVVLAAVLCCTRLENGSDTFAPASAGSDPSGAGRGGASASGGTVSTSAGAASGGMLPAMASEGGTSGADGASEAAGAGGAPDCVDEAGFEGRGCYSCEPYDGRTLQDACTDATCVWFDNEARLPRVVDGALPELPTLATPNAGGSGGGGSSAGGAGGSSGTSGGVGVSCQALTEAGNVIYVTGSSAVKPFLGTIAAQLASQKIFIVYTSVGSCVGVDAMVNGTPLRTGAAPLPASAAYWDPSEKACDLPVEGVGADLGISDVFAASCPDFELVNLESLKIRDAHGPIQTMTFAVPANSRYREISQQAAYLVFGFGKDGNVLDPAGDRAIWADETKILQRSATSGTQAMLAAAIGVPPAQWKGKTHKTSDDVATALRAAVASQEDADASIGILSADTIDSKNLRAELRMLAYQDSHQSCAFSPDSTAKSNDKRNVRDGHYPIWGPLHLLYKINAAGEPLNSGIRAQLLDIVGYLSGSKPLPNNLSLIDVYAKSGLVPECAMRVTRTADGGPITPARPASPCSCLFDEALGGKKCASCKVQGDCSAGQTCSRGYCED